MKTTIVAINLNVQRGNLHTVPLRAGHRVVAAFLTEHKPAILLDPRKAPNELHVTLIVHSPVDGEVVQATFLTIEPGKEIDDSASDLGELEHVATAPAYAASPTSAVMIGAGAIVVFRVKRRAVEVLAEPPAGLEQEAVVQ